LAQNSERDNSSKVSKIMPSSIKNKKNTFLNLRPLMQNNKILDRE
jgi:hypothetical protein